ncbi:MAG: hypothetical protein ABSF18_01295 [Gammaproteobacteria bacterium]|jgi:hypothetical protein
MNTQAFTDINQRLDALEANPLLKDSERHKEYYGHSSVHGGSTLKEHAMMVCASVDEDTEEYKTMVLPLMKRIDNFFAHPDHELDFVDEVHLLRARRLIEQGKYQQADKVYAEIPYSPIYAKAFQQRNHYFINAAKNHIHLMKKLTHPAHVKHQLLSAFHALYYVREYDHMDDVNLYQNAEAIFAHNDYNEAKMMMEKLCTESLPESLNSLNQKETLIVFDAIHAYKNALTHWRDIVKTLQKHFIELLFSEQQFRRPDDQVLPQAHELLDEPTSTFDVLQHMIGKTSLEKDFLAALVGNAMAVQHLQRFAQK